MIQRARGGRQGVTMVEFLAASSIATVLGGVTLLLMTGMRQSYEAHTTFQQLSGYLDVATTVLRKDIWEATEATPTAGDGVCPNDWLGLTNPSQPAIYPITYCLDNTTDPTNVTLRRTSNEGTAWPVAQHILEGINTTALIDTPQPDLITIHLQVSRTVNGRTYTRQMIDLTYRMQSAL